MFKKVSHNLCPIVKKISAQLGYIAQNLFVWATFLLIFSCKCTWSYYWCNTWWPSAKYSTEKNKIEKRCQEDQEKESFKVSTFLYFTDCEQDKKYEISNKEIAKLWKLISNFFIQKRNKTTNFLHMLTMWLYKWYFDQVQWAHEAPAPTDHRVHMQYLSFQI